MDGYIIMEDVVSRSTAQEKIIYINKSDDDPEEFELRNKSEGSLKSDSSISKISIKENPMLIKATYISNFILSVICVIMTTVGCLKKRFYIYDFILIDSEMNYLSLGILYISIIFFIICNIMMFKAIYYDKNDEIINICLKSFKGFFAGSNFCLGFICLIGVFSKKQDLIDIILFVCGSGAGLFLTRKYYRKITNKRGIEFQTLVIVWVYTSVLSVIFTYSLLYNISSIIIYIKNNTNNELNSMFITSLNQRNYLFSQLLSLGIIQLLIGVVLIVYFNDIFYMIGTSLFIYIPQIIYLVGIKETCSGILWVMIFSIIIAGFKIFKSGKKILGTIRKEDEDLLVKQKTSRSLSRSS